MNKKGFARLFTIIVLMIGMTVSAFVAAYIYQQFRARIEGRFEQNAIDIFELVLPAVTIQNWLIVFVFVGSIIAVVVSASMVRRHPVFFISSLIVFIVAAGIVAPIASNLFDGMMNNTNMQQFENLYFTETSYLMNNFPFYIVIAGIVIGIAVYAKFVSEGR